MHKNHDKEEGVLSLCVVAGLFIVGRLVGGNKILSPRVLTLFDEQVRDKEGKPLYHPDGSPVLQPKMRMAPLPCNPPSIFSSRIAMTYPIPEEDINTRELYARVTAPPPQPSQGSPLVQ